RGLGEGQSQRCVALGHERDTLDRFDELRPVDLRDRVEAVRKKSPVLGELSVEQASGGASAATLETDHAVAAVTTGKSHGDLGPGGQRLDGVVQGLGR